MIITKSTPFTKEEIEKLKKRYKFYIKTVIDIENIICSAGMEWHYEGEKILLEQGSYQSDVWGGGIDLEEKVIIYDAFINVRPRDNNTSNEIQSASVREKYESISKFFFSEIV